VLESIKTYATDKHHKIFPERYADRRRCCIQQLEDKVLPSTSMYYSTTIFPRFQHFPIMLNISFCYCVVTLSKVAVIYCRDSIPVVLWSEFKEV